MGLSQCTKLKRAKMTVLNTDVPYHLMVLKVELKPLYLCTWLSQTCAWLSLTEILNYAPDDVSPECSIMTMLNEEYTVTLYVYYLIYKQILSTRSRNYNHLISGLYGASVSDSYHCRRRNKPK